MFDCLRQRVMNECGLGGVFLPVAFATKRFSCLAGYPGKRSLAIPRWAVYVTCCVSTTNINLPIFHPKERQVGWSTVGWSSNSTCADGCFKTSVVNLPPGGNHWSFISLNPIFLKKAVQWNPPPIFNKFILLGTNISLSKTRASDDPFPELVGYVTVAWRVSNHQLDLNFPMGCFQGQVLFSLQLNVVLRSCEAV